MQFSAQANFWFFFFFLTHIFQWFKNDYEK